VNAVLQEFWTRYRLGVESGEGLEGEFLNHHGKVDINDGRGHIVVNCSIMVRPNAESPAMESVVGTEGAPGPFTD